MEAFVFKYLSRRPRVRWILVALILMMSVDYVLARAGGGVSSDSGSGSGGSGSGGDLWALIQLIRWLLWLDVNYPVIGLPLTAGIGYVVYRSYRGGEKVYQNNVITRGSRAAASNLVTAGLRQLCGGDAAFNTIAFCDRVRGGFTKLQRAWCEQSLVSVRPFISDGIHERFSLQFEEQRALGYRPMMENLSILGCSLAQVECGPVFDVVTVRIAATARDYRVSVEKGGAISGSEAAAQFVEYWSFIRARGTKTTPNRAGLIEGNCPNCGAPIAMNQGAKCEYCQAVLRSGQYDWVLAEITQEEKWNPRTTPAPGTLRIRDTDAGFNLQDLEDVTSVIFWRKSAADRTGRIDPMRKVAAAEWCDRYAATLAVDAGGAARSIFCDCAVSAVDTMGIILGENGDRALVEVCWMGRAFETNAAGSLHDLRGGMIFRQSLFVLGRRAGVVSTPEHSISSAHCPNCGGAVMADTSNACEFCHTVLNDGTRNWVLRAIWPSGSPEARALLVEAVAGSRRDESQFRAIGSPARSGSTGAFAWMIRSAVSDGFLFDDSVREMLRKAGEKNGIPAERVQELIHSAATGQMDISTPADATQARAWLTEMAVAAMLSGGISRQEVSLIRKVGARCGLVAADVKDVMLSSRREALARSKVELRTAKAEKALAKAPTSAT